MSLFTHPETSGKIYVAHPPRTGGRYLQHLLIANGWSAYHNIYDVIYKGQEIPHCDLSRYRDFIDLENVKVIGIARDPLQRYTSILSIIRNFNNSELRRWKYSNCFTPQSKFFPQSAHIWKFEDGFGADFNEWACDVTSSQLPLEPEVPKTDFDGFDKIETTQEMKAFCSVFYFEDYVRFRYGD